MTRKLFDIKNYNSIEVKDEIKCFNNASESFAPNITSQEYFEKGKSLVASENSFWKKWAANTLDESSLKKKRNIKADVKEA